MKAHITSGAGFRGAAEYIADAQKKGAERVGGNMTGESIAELMAEFSVGRKLRPDIKKPVWHCSLSLADGEHFSSEKWDQITADYMQRMGFASDAPFVVIRHKDTDHDHVHILASRITFGGKVWSDSFDVLRAIQTTQDMERDYGMVLSKGYEAKAAKKALTAAETAKAIKTGEEPARQRLQRLVTEAAVGGPTAVEFADRLTRAGVEVRANIASTGKFNGFGFRLDGLAFKGSDLGADYKWTALQKQGVTYEKDRDAEALGRYRAASPSVTVIEPAIVPELIEARIEPAAAVEHITATPATGVAISEAAIEPDQLVAQAQAAAETEDEAERSFYEYIINVGRPLHQSTNATYAGTGSGGERDAKAGVFRAANGSGGSGIGAGAGGEGGSVFEGGEKIHRGESPGKMEEGAGRVSDRVGAGESSIGGGEGEAALVAALAAAADAIRVAAADRSEIHRTQRGAPIGPRRAGPVAHIMRVIAGCARRIRGFYTFGQIGATGPSQAVLVSTGSVREDLRDRPSTGDRPHGETHRADSGGSILRRPVDVVMPGARDAVSAGENPHGSHPAHVVHAGRAEVASVGRAAGAGAAPADRAVVPPTPGMRAALSRIFPVPRQAAPKAPAKAAPVQAAPAEIPEVQPEAETVSENSTQKRPKAKI